MRRPRRDLQALVRRSYWREEDGRQIVEAWRRSGEPVSVFAGGLGIDPRRVSRWATRLNDTGSPVQFVPVRVATGESDGRRQACIEIDLGGERRVRVTPGFTSEDLRRVLAVLDEHRTC